jgi:hypothetical protein
LGTNFGNYTGTLPINKGGTGAVNAASASSNLLGTDYANYAGKLPLNTNVKNTLAVTNGGTGAANTTDASNNLMGKNFANYTNGPLPISKGGTGVADNTRLLYQFDGADLTTGNALVLKGFNEWAKFTITIASSDGIGFCGGRRTSGSGYNAQLASTDGGLRCAISPSNNAIVIYYTGNRWGVMVSVAAMWVDLTGAVAKKPTDLVEIPIHGF